jgi:phosphoribosylformylglycinamidine synthase
MDKNITVKALVLAGFGINGEREMAQSFIQAGAQADIVHINDLISGEKSFDDYQILAFPGGFAYGDDLGAGVALANRLRNNLSDELRKFTQRQTLTIGICNGFQMMVNLGILPGFEENPNERSVALKHNEVGKYQCLWTHVKNQSQKCIWTKGLEIFPLSVGHGEGNFYCEDSVLEKLKANDQIALRYCDASGEDARGKNPINPNGSIEDIAGICDQSGRIFGLMPHPDRFLTAYHENLWTLRKEEAKRKGEEFSDKSIAQKIYENAVNWFKS